MLKQIANKLRDELHSVDPFCIVGIGKDRKSLEVYGSYQYKDKVPEKFQNLRVIFKYEPINLE